MILYIRNCFRAKIFPQIINITRTQKRFSSSKQENNVTKVLLSDLPKFGTDIIKNKETNDISPEKLRYLESLPASMRSVRETMDKYPDYVVLTQLGSFYEMYFETATKFGDLLNLKVAKKTFKNVEVPMAGFPLYRIDQHLMSLVTKLNQGVVIVDQYKDDEELGSDAVTRRVTKIISAGTLIDEQFLNEQYYNFLLSIEFPENIFTRAANPETLIGLSWVDISVGCVFVQEVTLNELASAITRISPREILLDQSLMGIKLNEWYQELTDLKNHPNLRFRNTSNSYRPIDTFYHMFDSNNTTLKNRISDLTSKQITSLRNLLRYIDEHFPETAVHLQLPERKFSSNMLQIDSRTADTLELHKTSRDQYVKGSLLSCVKRTVTPSGSRLLSQWIAAPSTDITEIKQRQNIVTLFYSNSSFMKIVISYLKECHDIGRIVQRLSMGRGSALDLVNLASTVSKYQELRDFIKSETKDKSIAEINDILLFPDGQENLVKLILKDIDVGLLMDDLRLQESQLKKELDPLTVEEDQSQEELKPSSTQFFIRENASPALKSLHKELKDYYKAKVNLENDIQELLEEGSFKDIQLKITTRNTYEVYVKGNRNSDYNLLLNALKDSVVTQKHTYTRWLHYPLWSTLGRNIELTKLRIHREENLVIKALQKKVIKKSITLRKIGDFLDFLDITSSFAVLAKEKNLVLPEVNTTTDLEIVNGRHLVVEDSLKKDLKHFVANDLYMNKEDRLWVITGPNMGGKSTFLRQNAVIIILAQMGCYVPAESAKIGIVDKLFSRVNSSDDLFNNLSTFMVEMVETSYILNGATDRSLAVLDEIGRGTTPSEGIAVAYATLKHLLDVNKSRVLFSTHYGKEICNLIESENGEGHIFKKIQVIKKKDKVKFTHKLIDGVADKAYAIQIAKRAGFPENALDQASKTLEKLLSE